jgi:uncharacterized protein YcsI (UPF0317 family)
MTELIHINIIRYAKYWALKRQTNDTPARTHAQKPACEHEDVPVSWNQGVHTDREIMGNMPDIFDVHRPVHRNILVFL